MEWHLYELMARHKIRTAVELQQRLQAVGIAVTRSHLAKLVLNNPKRLSSELVYGLTEVFGCTTDELWSNPNARTRGTTIQGSGSQSNESRLDTNVESMPDRRKAPAAPSSDLPDDIGPPALPFKNPADKK